VIRSVADVAECLIATRPRSEELRTVTEPMHEQERKPSEDGSCVEQKDFLLKITKGQKLLVLQTRHRNDTCNVYPYVSGEFTPVEIYSKRQ